MTTPWLELEDVRLNRSGRPVLRGFSAQVTGRAVGLVGANGAGKSSLIGALLGVLPVESGRIRVLDYTVPQDAMALRARAGVMAEQAGIFPGGSAVDAVAFAGALNGLGRREALRRAHRALDALGVGEERYRPTAGYSTGMRQKCKLAMSLAHDPDLLILDEPTVGLDPMARAQLLSLVGELSERVHVLFSTHIMQDAEAICDQLVLLEDGVAAYSGTTMGLVGDRDHVVLARGAGLGPALAAVLESRGVEVQAAEEGWIRFVATSDSVVAFWHAAAEARAEVRHLGPEVRSLEDAVVAVMERNHG